MISVELPVLKTVSQLLAALPDILTPVTGVVNNLLHLNVIGVVDALLCAILKPCDNAVLSIASRLDISVDAASASSYVTDFDCSSEASKSLTVRATTAIANLGVGKIDPVQAFSGRLDVPEIKDDADTCTITISYESRLIDLTVARTWRYTHESQQVLFPGDLGFEYVTTIQDREITWGRG